MKVKMRVAIDYMLKRFDQFEAFVTDIRIPLSNNDVEWAPHPP